MTLVERKEIAFKQVDIKERIRLNVNEVATFKSLRKALCFNNSDGLDGSNDSGYRFNIGRNVLPIAFEHTALLWPSRFYLILLETFHGEACDETRELKLHASSKLKAVIKVKKYAMLAYVRSCVDACFHENVLPWDHFFNVPSVLGEEVFQKDAYVVMQFGTMCIVTVKKNDNMADIHVQLDKDGDDDM
eukprot:5724397-Ditylum_brightwellii.AAC.1